MTTFVVSTDKSKEQIHQNLNNSSFNPTYSLERWAKRAESISPVRSNSVYNDEFFILVSARKSEDRINIKEYGQPVSHTSLRGREYTGGEFIGLNDVQNEVIRYLSRDDKIIQIYLDHHTNKDSYMIITDKEYPMFSLQLADVYWKLFDGFQDTAPSYSFEFEHFKLSEIPTHTVRMREMFNRGQ